MRRLGAGTCRGFSTGSQTMSNGSAPGLLVIPGAGVHRGKDAVAGFFTTLAENTDFQAFEPREFIAQGDTVVALIHSEATARSTGRKVVDDAAHIWSFRDDKVARFRVIQDAALVAAYG